MALAAVVLAAAGSSCQSIAYGPIGGSAGTGQTYKLDENGYIRNWLVLAPIYFGSAYNAEEIEQDQIPGEANMTPAAGDKQKVRTVIPDVDLDTFTEKTLTWEPVATKDFALDFNEWLGLDGSQGAGGYAVTYLVAPDDMRELKLGIGSNDDGKIFLNGKRVWGLVAARSLEEDSDIVEHVTLKKGVNVLIFKVWNDANNWQGCVRLMDKDGNAVRNVEVRLSR